MIYFDNQSKEALDALFLEVFKTRLNGNLAA